MLCLAEACLPTRRLSRSETPGPSRPAALDPGSNHRAWCRETRTAPRPHLSPGDRVAGHPATLPLAPGRRAMTGFMRGVLGGGSFHGAQKSHVRAATIDPLGHSVSGGAERSRDTSTCGRAPGGRARALPPAARVPISRVALCLVRGAPLSETNPAIGFLSFRCGPLCYAVGAAARGVVA